MACALSVVVAAPSFAAETGPNFGLRAIDPASGLLYYVYSASPGDTISGQIRVQNEGSATGSVALYAVDATTGQTSGVVYLSGQAPKADVGVWITLGAHTLTLAAGEGRVVSFEVRVPADAKPGQRVGGIVAQNLTLSAGSPQPVTNGGALLIKIRTLNIVAVQVNVAGPERIGVAISGVQPGGTQGHQALLIGLENTGNTILKPQGVMDVTDAVGQRVQHLTFALDSVLPWTAIDYPVLVRTKALGAGTYEASIAMTYAPGRVERYRGSFVITQQQVDQEFQGAAAALAPPPPASHLPILMIVAGFGGALLLGSMTGVIAIRRRRPA